jgi:acyl carrier protein
MWHSVQSLLLPLVLLRNKRESSSDKRLSLKRKTPTEETSSLSREQLLAAKPGEQRQMLEAYLLECLASSLQIPINEFNSEQSLATLVDSLMAIILRNCIETDLQVSVPMEKFFGETTVTQLAEFLLNQLTLANLISLDSIANEGEEREVLTV